MSTPTPETAALVAALESKSDSFYHSRMTEHARRLERERDEARAEVEAFKNNNRYHRGHSAGFKEAKEKYEADLADAQNRVKELYGALNFKSDTPHEIVMADARQLRPEMAKARARVLEIEGSFDYWLNNESILEKGGALSKVWAKLKQAESDLAAAQKDREPKEFFKGSTVLLHGVLGYAEGMIESPESETHRRLGYCIKHLAENALGRVVACERKGAT